MIEVAGGRRVLLDAAHNPAGAYALAAYVRREFPEALPIVFGALRDKDAAMMLKALLPVASRIVLTEPPSARARPAEELAAIVREISPEATIEIESRPGRRAGARLEQTVPSPASLDRSSSLAPMLEQAWS